MVKAAETKSRLPRIRRHRIRRQNGTGEIKLGVGRVRFEERFKAIGSLLRIPVYVTTPKLVQPDVVLKNEFK